MSKKLTIVSWLLLVYVLLQFFWWAIQLYTLSGGNLWMVLGEGTVFIVILVIGFLFVRRTLKKEAELNDRQRNFLAAVAHELKTPIAGMRLYLETLLKRDPPKEQRIEILEKSIRQNVRLERLVLDVLMVANMQENKVKWNRETIELMQWFNELCAELLPQAIVIGPQQCELSIDPKALELVFSNLLDNARKYGAPGYAIKVEDLGPSVRISVSDCGPGIPAKEKQKVMEQFYRMGDEMTRSNQGTGLGLYLVNQIVKSCAGELSVKDNQLKGCIFVVQFKRVQ